MAFRLVKWYLDVVGADGDLAIVYAADIGLAGMHLTANALLDSPRTGAGEERTAIVGARMPEPTAEGWRWACERLGAMGSWRRPHAAVAERTLHAIDAKRVRWECIAPTSHATLTTPRRTIEGPGYLERLELTLEPWRLPIETLRWGRFATYARSVVWIQWRGTHPIDLVLVDGVEHSVTSIDDHAVRWGGGHVELAPQRTIRDAPLGAGALAWLPKVTKALPVRLLRAHETKWFGDATLHEADRTTSGTALWERVTFDEGTAR